MQRIALFSLLLLLPGLAACSATDLDSRTPRQVAAEVADLLVAGDEGAAAELFDAWAEDEGARQAMYPVLFDIAEEHYDTGSARDAAAIMRFTASRYPNSLAAKEALLYSLLLQRAEEGALSRSGLDEMGDLVRELEGRAQNPAWVSLAAIWYWIDRDRPEQAAEAWRDFQDTWNGRPSYLKPELVEIERWLETKGALELTPKPGA